MSHLSKQCAECGITFNKKVNISLKEWNTKSKYCSYLCSRKHTLLDGSKQPSNEKRKRGESNHKWKGGQLEFICKTCQVTFKVDRDRPDAKTCSQACNKVYRKSLEFRENLAKTQRNRPGYTRSLDWKIIVRTCSRYAQWRTKVFIRDNYTCQDCGQKGGRLNADHITPFSLIAKQFNLKSVEDAFNCKALWNISNGRTLCLQCHWNTSTFGTKAKKSLLANVQII